MTRTLGVMVDSGVVLIEPGEVRAIETPPFQAAMRLDCLSFSANGWRWLPLSLVALPSTDNLLFWAHRTKRLAESAPGQVVGGRVVWAADGDVNPGDVLQLRVRNDMHKHGRFRGIIYAIRNYP